MTELRGKLTNLLQIKSINENSFSLFISKESTSHNGGVPFPLKEVIATACIYSMHDTTVHHIGAAVTCDLWQILSFKRIFLFCQSKWTYVCFPKRTVLFDFV